MARPRVFVSSTYYDLRQVRSDLERFIHELGFDPVLHEAGSITLGADAKLEDYCYSEIENCDIVVSLIGGRFGTPSTSDDNSISHKELKRAHQLRKQIYVFVERSVYAEYRLWQKNRQVSNITWSTIDDTRVFAFIDEVQSLPVNNQLRTFEVANDVTSILREQWAGLFQRFLQEHTAISISQGLDRIEATTKTLESLVSLISTDRASRDSSIEGVLLFHHPAFATVKRVLKITYRVVFVDRQELTDLVGARQFRPVDAEEWDSPKYEEFIKHQGEKYLLLKVRTDIFDNDGKLKPFDPQSWKEHWISCEERLRTNVSGEEVPF